MRKQIALILAVAVMLCMPVRAAAESTTITTVVPEPAYQLTIPADIQMEYRAGSCTIGVPSIAQSSGFGEKAYLTVAVSHSGAFSSQTTSTTIPFAFYAKTDGGLCEWASGDRLIYSRMDDGSVTPSLILNKTELSFDCEILKIDDSEFSVHQFFTDRINRE